MNPTPLNPKITCQTLEETLEKVDTTPSFLDRGLIYEVCLRVFEQIKTDTEVQEKLPPITAKIEAIPQKFWFSYRIYTIYRTIANFFSQIFPKVFHHLGEEQRAYETFIQSIATKSATQQSFEEAQLSLTKEEEKVRHQYTKSTEQETFSLMERLTVGLEAVWTNFHLSADEKQLYDSLLKDFLQEKEALTSQLLSDVESKTEKTRQVTTAEESATFRDLQTRFHTALVELEEEATRDLLATEANEMTSFQIQAEKLILLNYTEKARAAEQSQDYSTAFSLWKRVLSGQKADPTDSSYKKALLHWTQAHVLSEQSTPPLTREHLPYLMALGKFHMGKQSLVNAAKFLDRVLEISPDHPEAIRLATEIRAEILVASHKFQEAYPLFLELGLRERAAAVVNDWRGICEANPPLETILALGKAFLDLDQTNKADSFLLLLLKNRDGVPEGQREPLLSLYKKRLEAQQARNAKEKMEKHRLTEIIYHLEGGRENSDKLFQSCLDELRSILRTEPKLRILRDQFESYAKLAIALTPSLSNRITLAKLCSQTEIPKLAELAIKTLHGEPSLTIDPDCPYKDQLKEALEVFFISIGYPLVEPPSAASYTSEYQLSLSNIHTELLPKYALLYSELFKPEETLFYWKRLKELGYINEKTQPQLCTCLQKAIDKHSMIDRLNILEQFYAEWPIPEIQALRVNTYNSLIKEYDARIAEGTSLPAPERLRLDETRFKYILELGQLDPYAVKKERLDSTREALTSSYRLAAKDYEKAQKWQEAVQYILKALELNESLKVIDPRLYKRLGVYYYHLKKPTSALYFLSKTTAKEDSPDESRIRHILAGDQACSKALATLTSHLKQQICQFVQKTREDPFWQEIEGALGGTLLGPWPTLAHWSKENQEFGSLGQNNTSYEETKKEVARAVQLMVTAYDYRHLRKTIPETLQSRIEHLQNYLETHGPSNASLLTQALQEYGQAHQGNPDLYEPYLNNLYKLYSIVGNREAMAALQQKFPDKF